MIHLCVYFHDKFYRVCYHILSHRSYIYEVFHQYVVFYVFFFSASVWSFCRKNSIMKFFNLYVNHMFLFTLLLSELLITKNTFIWFFTCISIITILGFHSDAIVNYLIITLKWTSWKNILNDFLIERFQKKSITMIFQLILYLNKKIIIRKISLTFWLQN